jgi:hypothetical protein
MKHVGSEIDWTEYRKLPNAIEVDFHFSEYGPRSVPYCEAMAGARENALQALRKAYEIDLKYVIFTHGRSTSRAGVTTARSEVRNLIRSKDATAFITRRDCTQHPSCYVVAIRPNPNAKRPALVCPRCDSTNPTHKSTAGHFRCSQCLQEFGWFDL